MLKLRKLLPILPVFILGLSSLAPSVGVGESSYVAGSATSKFATLCINRDFMAAIKGGRWEWRDVCASNEFVTSATGQCPLKGTLVGTGPDWDMNQRVYLLCSASGTAHFSATCCRKP